VVLTEEKIVKNKIATQAEVDKIKNAINQEIEDALKFAEESDYPLGSELYDDNYVQEDYPFIMD
jgi:pyruvate dehydrogenase E1 component alpha subunit